MKKRLIIFTFIMASLFIFGGCQNNEDLPTPDEIASQETQEITMVGNWVVEKTDISDGPLKGDIEALFEEVYYIGSTAEYTEDGRQIINGIENGTYKILNDSEIEFTSAGGVMVNKYSLTEDTFVLYGTYTGSYAYLNETAPPLCTIYYKRH